MTKLEFVRSIVALRQYDGQVWISGEEAEAASLLYELAERLQEDQEALKEYIRMERAAVKTPALRKALELSNWVMELWEQMLRAFRAVERQVEYPLVDMHWASAFDRLKNVEDDLDVLPGGLVAEVTARLWMGELEPPAESK